MTGINCILILIGIARRQQQGKRPLMFTAFTSFNDGELEGKEVNANRARALQCPLVVISVQFIWIVTQ